MKKIFLSVFLVLSLNAQNLEIDKIRTDLYSKSGSNVLKKVEISLEFDGNNLKENENKLIDAVNTVISGFFYEDIFTEIGKNNFKKTLEKFLDKKYKIKLIVLKKRISVYLNAVVALVQIIKKKIAP